MKFPSFQCILPAFSFLVSFGTGPGAKELADTLRHAAREIKETPGMSEPENARHTKPLLSCLRTANYKGYHPILDHQLKSGITLRRQPVWLSLPLLTDQVNQYHLIHCLNLSNN